MESVQTMMVKKKIAVLLCAIIAGSVMFAGCGDNNDNSQSGNATNTNSHTVTENNSKNNEDNNSKQDNNSKDDNNSKEDNNNSKDDNNSETPVGEKADVSYFDDCVFIGDSVSLKLKLYNDKNNAMSKAKFLTSGSLGYGNALWDLDNPEAVFPSYQGENVLLEDGVVLTGASKVYIMLGMNDIGLYGVDGSFDNMKTLTNRILEKSPNVTIYLQSVTPILSGMEGKTWNNQNINIFNDKLKAYCEENDNFKFVDVASVMKDSNGCLIAEYCSDPDIMGIHFTDMACKVWIDYLLTHTN